MVDLSECYIKRLITLTFDQMTLHMHHMSLTSSCRCTTTTAVMILCVFIKPYVILLSIFLFSSANITQLEVNRRQQTYLPVTLAIELSEPFLLI